MVFPIGERWRLTKSKYTLRSMGSRPMIAELLKNGLEGDVNICATKWRLEPENTKLALWQF